jgi:hypothetical protein
VSDIDTAVVDGLKVLDPNGRLEKLPRSTGVSARALPQATTAAAKVSAANRIISALHPGAHTIAERAARQMELAWCVKKSGEDDEEA